MFYLYSTERVLRNSYQVFELKEPIHLCYDDYFCYPIEQMEKKTIRLCLSISKQKHQWIGTYFLKTKIYTCENTPV